MANSSFSVMKHDETINYILCPLCGCPFKPNEMNLCLKCLRSETDITSEIIKKNRKLSIKHCGSCKRWYNNKISKWKETEIGSPDLKDMLLQKIRGLNKKEYKILNSSFICNCNSKEIEIKIDLEKDVIFDNKESVKIDDIFCIKFDILSSICNQCAISNELHLSWKSVVEIKYNSNYHLFLFLEQLLIKHHHKSFTECIEFEQIKNGINCYFNTDSMARIFINHLKEIIVIKHNTSNAKNENCSKNNIQKYKTRYFMELPLINYNDLCLIPIKLQKKCGGYSPLMICYKISSKLHFIEPTSLHQFEIDSKQYFKYNFNHNIIASIDKLNIFYVLNVIPMKKKNNYNKNGKLFEIELVRESDLGGNDEIILESITNLNNIKCGDFVKGYDINKLLQNNTTIKFKKKMKIYDVIIIEKYYHNNNKIKKWKLKRINNIKINDNYKTEKYLEEKQMRDYQIFLNQIKMHKLLRAQINIYKNDKYQHEQKDNDDDDNDDDEDDDEEDDIGDDELIDEITSNLTKQNDIEMDND